MPRFGMFLCRKQTRCFIYQACRRWSSTLVFADVKNLQSTLSAVTASKSFNQPTYLLVAGKKINAFSDELTKYDGVTAVYECDSDLLHHNIASTHTDLLRHMLEKSGRKFSVVLAPVCSTSRDIFPRFAAMQNVQLINDVVQIKSVDTFVRPIYAGNILNTVKSTDTLKIMTIRPTAFTPSPEAEVSARVEKINDFVSVTDVKWLEDIEDKGDMPKLSSSKIVVSGGRGLQSAEDFQKILEPLRKKLGAAMGATRAVVDSGIVPNDMQIGQTGKIVAPQLYIAVGISGAIQHLAGMKDSKTIVAINNDPEAPIFQIADLGLVADLYKAVPELTGKISQQ